jgi:hypothetical protein
MHERMGVGDVANEKRRKTYVIVAYYCGAGKIDPTEWKRGVAEIKLPAKPLV